MKHFRLVPLFLLILAAVACETVPARGDSANGGPHADGEQLYRQSCARCHALYMPRSFTAGEWKFFVRKYGRKARLSRSKRDTVLGYLAAHALPG